MIELRGDARKAAAQVILEHHYTHTIPAGKSYYIAFGDALIVWSIPANKNIGRFLLKAPGKVWELSRLYAPDGHEPNLLTRAISLATKFISQVEHPDALVSYADPNAGHTGGVYRAASWLFHGRCERTRMYQKDGRTAARRAFHSGPRGATKAAIEAAGWTEVYQPGKLRFVKPLSRRAKAVLQSPQDSGSQKASK